MARLDVEKTFSDARAKADAGYLVVVRTDGQALLLRPPSKESGTTQLVAAVEGLIPPTPKRSVAVVADTAWALDSKTTLKEANRAIPFFGLLMGVVSIGHAVWIFGSSSDLKVGCRDADVLIVDGACLAALPKDWGNIASMAMKNPEIFVHDRASYQLLRG